MGEEITRILAWEADREYRDLVRAVQNFFKVAEVDARILVAHMALQYKEARDATTDLET